MLANRGKSTAESATGTGVNEMGSTSAASPQTAAASRHAASSRGRNLQPDGASGGWWELEPSYQHCCQVRSLLPPCGTAGGREQTVHPLT